MTKIPLTAAQRRKQKQKARAVALYTQKMALADCSASAVYQHISQKLGISVSSVITYLQDAGVIPPRKPKPRAKAEPCQEPTT